MDPMVTSTLISTGANLVGSLFGGGKGPGMKQQINDQRRINQQWDDYAFRSKMNLAKEFKIHPLTMLGAQLPQGSSTVYDSRNNDNMGQNVARSLAKGVSDYYTKKANSELEELALERARLENDLLRAQTTNINRSASTVSGTPIGSSTSQAPMGQYDVEPDVNKTRFKGDPGLTAGSGDPPPAGKKFMVGNTPHGPVYITLPPSGQADEYGEVYGAIKGLEYMAKRGFVHYANGAYRASKKLADQMRKSIPSPSKAKPYKYQSTKNNPMFK